MPKIRFLAPMLIALVAAGCGTKGVTLKTAPVSGKVTLSDKPLAGATVMFVPETEPGAPTPPTPSGLTDADGVYKLSTMASGSQVVEGAPPRRYRVIITKSQGGAGPPGVEAGMSPDEVKKKFQSASAEEQMKMAGTAQMGPGAQQKSEVPARYGKVDESGLTATVADGGAQTFDFTLTAE
jgi:hypothetical protein